MTVTSRQSSFFSRTSKPKRPYNWVQWTGEALIWLSLVLLLAQIAADLGVIRLDGRRLAPLVLLPLLIGNLLVSSRREPIDEATAEVLASRRRLQLLLIVVGSVLVAITLHLLKGA